MDRTQSSGAQVPASVALLFQRYFLLSAQLEQGRCPVRAPSQDKRKENVASSSPGSPLCVHDSQGNAVSPRAHSHVCY